MVIAFLEYVLNLGIFTHAPIPHSEFQNSGQNLFSPTAETSGGKNMICSIKIHSEKMKIKTYNIRLFIFYMFCNFSKCDGFTVL